MDTPDTEPSSDPNPTPRPQATEHEPELDGAEPGPGRYNVEALRRALDILDVLRGSRAELRLTDIAEKAHLDISTTFRLLRTLEGRGYVRRDRKTKRFQHCLGYRAYRIGYAQLSSDQPFVRKVTAIRNPTSNVT